MKIRTRRDQIISHSDRCQLEKQSLAHYFSARIALSQAIHFEITHLSQGEVIYEIHRREKSGSII